MSSDFLTTIGHHKLTRSTINESIRTSIKVLEQLKINLPPFAFWSPEEWHTKGAEVDEIRHCGLGWDVTDFGSQDFDKLGRTLFTLRNGSATQSPEKYPKPYAEKLLIEPENQRSPIHYHESKREDIINRGGGNVIVSLFCIGESGFPCRDGRITTSIDGCQKSFSSGSEIRLRPGESITVPPLTFHQFWAESGTGIRIDGVGYTISGEVSSVCDDYSDNRFIDAWSKRFPDVIEDEDRAFYLCNEYPGYSLALDTPSR